MYIKGKQHDKCFGTYSDLMGVHGLCVPFNDERNGRIQITPSRNHRIIMGRSMRSITLVPEDGFKIDLYGTISLIKGPSHFPNPFIKEIVRTRIKRSLMILPGRAEKVEIYWPFSATAFKELDSGQVMEKEFTPSSDCREMAKIDESWDVVVINNEWNHKKFQRIHVNPQARGKGIEWLRQKFEESNLLREPSGIFDHCRDILKSQQALHQSRSDEEWREWWEKSVSPVV